MSNEDALKEQAQEFQRERVKTARKHATMFGVISIAALIAVVYGLVQSVEADRQMDLVKVAAESCDKQRLEFEIAMKQIEQMTIELEVCKASKK